LLEFNIKAVPNRLLLYNEDVNNLLNAKFDEKKLSEYFGKNFVINNFTDWVKVSYGKYNFEFNNIEFTVEYYDDSEILNKYRLPLPKCLDDFINDMYRLNIDIYWTNKIITKYLPNFLIDKNNLENFIRYYLTKIEKEFELL
jgi:hypothetical protein